MRVVTPSGQMFVSDKEWTADEIAEKLTAIFYGRGDILRDTRLIEGLAHDIRQRLDVLGKKDWSRDWVDDKTFLNFVNKEALDVIITASYIDPCKELLDRCKWIMPDETHLSPEPDAARLPRAGHPERLSARLAVDARAPISVAPPSISSSSARGTALEIQALPTITREGMSSPLDIDVTVRLGVSGRGHRGAGRGRGDRAADRRAKALAGQVAIPF